MSTCPMCAESIAENVSICPFCGSAIAGVPSAQPATYDISQDAGVRMLLPVGRSVWAILAGYFGLFSLICFPAPIAVILGAIAIWDIRKHPEKHGMGRAIFGLGMGLVGTLFMIFVIIGIISEQF